MEWIDMGAVIVNSQRAVVVINTICVALLIHAFCVVSLNTLVVDDDLEYFGAVWHSIPHNAL
jgi:hypothetical protein